MHQALHGLTPFIFMGYKTLPQQRRALSGQMERVRVGPLTLERPQILQIALHMPQAKTEEPCCRATVGPRQQLQRNISWLGHV